MESISEAMKAYIQTHPFDSGDPDCKTVLEQLYRAYSESHENDPPEIQAVFAELETYLEKLPPFPITTQSSTSAVAFASITSAKPSSTVCSMVRP